MYTAPPSPFASVRKVVFRLHWATPPAAAAGPSKEEKRRRKRLKKEAKAERLRNFFGWCAGWQAYGSIF
ncbi:hypothetical protein EJV47_18060 [Hymenobacter gummosus]|uniref:Uncharacterized protein n=1 Tax=Hymenobacter gummosus TaxID=1776032 RepID=A0A3S0HLI4_9BACT|nr:hypothetical protein [Hymenobacter gummosus]RTQ47823.1 hypothetical protein EJV47_18060 [Hymenobacter gummosus]